MGSIPNGARSLSSRGPRPRPVVQVRPKSAGNASESLCRSLHQAVPGPFRDRCIPFRVHVLPCIDGVCDSDGRFVDWAVRSSLSISVQALWSSS